MAIKLPALHSHDPASVPSVLKILIIRFSSIGDVVLTTPVLRCIRQQIPGAEIHYLTKAEFAPALSANPNIDRLHLLRDNLDAVIPVLRGEHFDFVADLHHNIRTATRPSPTRAARPAW